MKNLIKISGVARILGCDQQTIRRYDRLGLYAPRRDRAGNRVFGPEDIETLRDIRASRRPGRPPKARGEGPTPTPKRRKRAAALDRSSSVPASPAAAGELGCPRCGAVSASTSRSLAGPAGEERGE